MEFSASHREEGRGHRVGNTRETGSRKPFLKYYSHSDTWQRVSIKGARIGQLDRITQAPDVMGGRACIRGMRVTVGMIVGQIGAGRGIDDLLADYPYLGRDDIM